MKPSSASFGSMHKTNPPFRAEHVGSFLRPPEVKDARARHERGELDAAGLTAVEDAAIERLIRRQEESGLQGVTDGEFRRAFWHYDFLQALDGVETYFVEQGFQFKGAAIKPLMERHIGSLERGKRADLIIVDMSSARQTPMYDPLSALVYTTRGSDVRTTIVNGKVLMRDRQVLTLDRAAVLAEARGWVEKVRAAVK